ncbi:hypothetical protein [Paenibacillus sp. MMO-177]|uniref:hypothetical protein n=1 Tax=Paenibacillus sp. MMO-177 TaxID=3081289 RepID=UPI00301AE72F
MKKGIFASAVIGIIMLISLTVFNVDNSNIAKFIRELKGHDLKVKDITKEVNKEMPNLNTKKNTILLVDESERIYIEIPEDVEKSVEEKIPLYTSPVIDFTGIPHLYIKDKLVVSYFGQNLKLLDVLEQLLGKSLVN